ncbi:MAG: alpha/beta fold hydrolase [Candidatus Heimdallarchaeota archaeon]
MALLNFVASFDGERIHYSAEGQHEICLLFVHGWGGYIDVWKHQKALASKYKLVFVDLAGHGKSTKARESFTMQSYAKDLKALVRELNLTNIILIGWSLGGAVMLEAERLFRDRIIGLVGIDTLELKGDEYAADYSSVYFKRNPEEIARYLNHFSSDFPESFLNFYKSFLTDKMDSNDVTELLATIKESDQRVMLSALEELMKWDLRKPLKELQKPLRLIMAGEESYNAPSIRNEFEKFFSAVVFMENVKHMLFWEEPIKFNELLEEQIQQMLTEL